MGETFGHILFLIIGFFIGALILFLLFCTLNRPCDFLSNLINPRPATCDGGACVQTGQLCGYGAYQVYGTDILTTTTYYGKCCEGLACVGGYCKVPSSQCIGLRQFCGYGPTNLSHYDSPAYYGECCQGYKCIDGYCDIPKECISQGESCSYASDCCTGFSCIDGKCGVKVCQTSGQCTSGNDCCSGYYCNKDTYLCTPEQTCMAAGYSCSIDKDCCSGLVCTNNKCSTPSMYNCSQTLPLSESDCMHGTCQMGRCLYIPAKYSNDVLVEKAKCWCDPCYSTDNGSIWTKGTCNNGTNAYSDYCLQEGGLLFNNYCLNGGCFGKTVNCSQTSPNAACYNGICVNPTCRTSGVCGTDSECCSGYYCSPNGYCLVRPTCRYEYASCNYSSDCCQPYICTNGSCSTPCSDTTTTCTNSSQCCSGHYCHYDNTCSSQPCNSSGGTCTSNTNCCSPYACVDGICSIPPTCQTSGRCNTDTDCCNHYYCSTNWYCTVCMTSGPCTKNSQCCDGYCNGDGYCSSQVCKTVQETCTNTTQCCYGLRCNYGICSTCATSGRCTSNSDCCQGYQCSSYYCAACSTGYCASSYECCPGYYCSQSQQCTPST